VDEASCQQGRIFRDDRKVKEELFEQIRKRGPKLAPLIPFIGAILEGDRKALH
jgi:hypothetical protein